MTASEQIRDARQTARVERYRGLCDRFGVDLDGNYSGAEDAGEILDGTVPCHQFCAITSAGEYVYAATYQTLQAAQAAAGEYIADDLYAEAPVAILDLDGTAEWRPIIGWEQTPDV